MDKSLLIPSAASCNKTLNTKTRSVHKVQQDKNNINSNFPFCSLGFLGVFVFEDFLTKKCKFKVAIE